MTSHPTPPGFPDSPRDFLANWTASRGNLRNFLENTYLPPIDDAAQREAGEAAAAAAKAEAEAAANAEAAEAPAEETAEA